MTIDVTEEKKKRSLGERLLMLRNENGLTQGELADRLAVSRQSISKWELNKALPDIEKLVIMAEMYRVSLDYLIKGEQTEEAELSGGNAGADSEKEGLLPAENGNTDEGETISLSGGTEKTDGKDTETTVTEEKSPISGKADRNRDVPVRRTILIICMLLCAGFFIYTIFFSWKLFSHYTLTKDGKSQELTTVDRIYEQYTKAEVSGVTQDGDFYQKIVWLDIPGVREGDFVYCYSDENGEGISFSYYSRTLVLPITAAVAALMFFLAFAVELRGLSKKEKGEK